MQNQDDLFLLVKSLTKNEKGYFKKLYAAFETGKDKDFLLLFDLLDESAEYDEAVLKKKLGRETKQLNFAVLKNYLTEKILQALRMFHQQFSAEYDLLSEIQELHLLKSKKLDHLLSRKLNKAMKTAEASGLNSLQLYLFWFENFTRNTSSLSEHFQSWNEIQLKLQLNLNDLKERFEVYNLFKEVEQLYRNQIGFGKKDNKRLKEIEKNELLNAKRKIHFGTEVIRNYVHSMICQMKDDAAGSYAYLKNNLKVYEQHKEYAHNNSTGQLGLLDSLIRMACTMDKFSEADKYFSALEKIEAQNEYDKDWNLSIRYEYLLTKAVSLQKFDEAVKRIDEIEKFYLTYPEILIPPQYARLMIVFYCAKRKDKSLEWAQRIIDMKDEKRQYGILQVLARCIAMIIYFEENNYSLLESQIGSARFYFSKHGIESKLTSTLGNALLKILKQIDKKERRKLLQKLSDDLKTILSAQKQNDFLNWFDFVQWAKEN